MKTAIPNSSLKAYGANGRQKILEALEFARQAHHGQLRRSGQPYITHPVAVAEYLIDIQMDDDTVVAALLHDTLEDTAVTYEMIADKFGPKVAELVDGVTKIGQIDYAPSGNAHRQSASIENVRKLLLAMSNDLRVIMIKLSDRRHNLSTLQYLASDDRQRIARESLDVFAPLADRLGMGILKAELEDLAFRYSNPEAYSLVKKLAADHFPESESYLEKLKRAVEEILLGSGMKAVSVHGRRKHLYSIYRKLTKAEGDIAKIYDLTALRIIVPEEADCYQVLGLLHQNYKPLIYRIKDYIAVPKPNGYRSLHTTVFALDGKIIEIQIRTPLMHREAEYGLAAHAVYNLHKDTKAYKSGQDLAAATKLSWIGELAGVTAAAEGAPELLESLKVDFFRDRIFVFSPKGDLYDLPEGAIPLDFAFAVHTDVGLRTAGAKINGRIVPLDRPLENRDVVEILTKKHANPSRHWLSAVKTASARSKIKAWFRAASRDTNIATGKELIEYQLPAWGLKKFEDIDQGAVVKALSSFNLKDADALLAAVGEGSIQLSTALRRLLPPAARPPSGKKPGAGGTHTGRMQVLGAPELPCAPASCCQPQPPDKLVGYITRGSGITVHRSTCPNVPEENDRLVDCGWEQVQPQRSMEVTLRIQCQNRLGIVHEITGVIASRTVNIVKIATSDDPQDPKLSWIEVNIQISDLYLLGELRQQLNRLAEVTKIQHQPFQETNK